LFTTTTTVFRIHQAFISPYLGFLTLTRLVSYIAVLPHAHLRTFALRTLAVLAGILQASETCQLRTARDLHTTFRSLPCLLRLRGTVRLPLPASLLPVIHLHRTGLPACTPPFPSDWTTVGRCLAVHARLNVPPASPGQTPVTVHLTFTLLDVLRRTDRRSFCRWRVAYAPHILTRCIKFTLKLRAP